MAPALTEPGTCLLEDRLGNTASARLFQDPTAVIEARRLEDVIPALEAAVQAQRAGKTLAGYIGYEAGYALEPRLAPLARQGEGRLPLLRFFVYDRSRCLTPRETDHAIAAACLAGHRLEEPEPALSPDVYCAKVERVLSYIRAGDIYQANFTFPLRGRLVGPPLSLYRALRAAQPVGFGAWLAMEEAEILSLSPELFVRREGDRLVTRPMKGTAARGTSAPDDERRRRALRADAKERAENLMIVDLLRNDLSRVCRPGSVDVRRLFDVETYPTLHTMTSTIEGRIAGEAEACDILRALFPCGSVTGAPKIRAQEIIRELETGERGVYTGAIGMLEPDDGFSFNVAIRTLTAYRDGTYVYPVGGGIVADSVPTREYDECLLKARVLAAEAEPFDLIETLAWSRTTGFAYLDAHLDRLRSSTRYFGRPFDRAAVRAALDEAVERTDGERLRVRLLLGPKGGPAVSTAPLPPGTPGPLTFSLACEAVDAADPYLRHKTTRRARFERELALAAEQGAREVLFENQYGELTEGAWTSLFVERAGELLTPPLSAGLLPGILRADLLASGRAREAPLTRADLASADAIYLGNSVRGLMKACPASRATQENGADTAAQVPA